MIAQKKEDGHFDYPTALIICQLDSLFSRREKRALDFGKKCVKHHSLKRLFPINPAVFNNPLPVRNREIFHDNRSGTSAYNNSAIPAIQRRLNQQF